MGHYNASPVRDPWVTSPWARQKDFVKSLSLCVNDPQVVCVVHPRFTVNPVTRDEDLSLVSSDLCFRFLLTNSVTVKSETIGQTVCKKSKTEIRRIKTHERKTTRHLLLDLLFFAEINTQTTN